MSEFRLGNAKHVNDRIMFQLTVAQSMVYVYAARSAYQRSHRTKSSMCQSSPPRPKCELALSRQCWPKAEAVHQAAP